MSHLIYSDILDYNIVKLQETQILKDPFTLTTRPPTYMTSMSYKVHLCVIFCVLCHMGNIFLLLTHI
jgi:hypothetical protein